MEKVSIIIPAYNKSQLTVKTVESVLKQTYPNIEIIVVDNGSVDDTKSALSTFGSCIKYNYKENQDACSARNLAIKEAEGDYIGFLDCDDSYCKEKVERSMKVLMQNPSLGFIHTGAYFINEEDVIVGEYPKSRFQGWISTRLIFGNYICNSTILARAQAVKEAGIFD